MKTLNTLLFTTLAFFLLATSTAVVIAGFSDKEETGNLKGKVIDSASEEAIPFANIALKNKDGELIATATTNFEGEYKLVSINPGKYTLKVSFVGYELKKIENVTVLSGKTEYISIELKRSTVTIDAMEVMSYSKSGRGSGKKKFRKEASSSAPSTVTRTISSEEVAYDYDIAPTVPEGDHISGEYERSPGKVEYKKAASVAAVPGIKAGTLTATELHDFSKWELWKDITENQLKAWQSHWKIAPVNRYAAQVTTHDGWPVIDQKVELTTEDGEVIWSTRTDNTGKAELWASMFDTAKTKTSYTLTTKHNGRTQEITAAKKFQEGMNYFVLGNGCNSPKVLDLMMVVDATGSMGDEINYLKSEMLDVVNRVKKKHEALAIKTGSVFYRDKSDDYVTRVSPFTDKVDNTIGFIKNQSAAGGGDFPEAVDAALEAALNEAEWSKYARARILFLVLDAPPHWDNTTIEKMQKLTAQAAKEGIRIVPVTGSGIDKKTEYLMRSLALATNGTYVAITSHSGVGGHHIEPTTDSYEVEKLNDLMVRVITQFTSAPDCNEEDPLAKIDTTIIPKPDIEPVQSDSSQSSKKPLDLFSFFPNPTGGLVNVVLKEKADELLITDLTGKLMRYKNKSQLETKMQIDLQGFSAGIYFIHVVQNGRVQSERLIVSP